MRCFQSERTVLARSIGLPLVVECVALVVPVHRPIVDPLRPVFHGTPRIFRHVVRRNDKVFELERLRFAYPFFTSTDRAANSKK